MTAHIFLVMYIVNDQQFSLAEESNGVLKGVYQQNKYNLCDFYNKTCGSRVYFMYICQFTDAVASSASSETCQYFHLIIKINLIEVYTCQVFTHTERFIYWEIKNKDYYIL